MSLFLTRKSREIVHNNQHDVRMQSLLILLHHSKKAISDECSASFDAVCILPALPSLIIWHGVLDKDCNNNYLQSTPL